MRGMSVKSPKTRAGQWLNYLRQSMCRQQEKTCRFTRSDEPESGHPRSRSVIWVRIFGGIIVVSCLRIADSRSGPDTSVAPVALDFY